MLVFLATLTTFFGDGSWECTYHYDYPGDNVREAASGRIYYDNDYAYVSERVLTYSKLDSGEVFAKFSFQESGEAHIQSKNEFYLDGRAYNFHEVLDPENHFPESYLQELDQFFNRVAGAKENAEGYRAH